MGVLVLLPCRSGGWSFSSLGYNFCIKPVISRFADGAKVIVRDCGVYEADECTPESQYENTKARGELCHCMGEKCNGGTINTPGVLKILLVLFIGIYFTM